MSAAVLSFAMLVTMRNFNLKYIASAFAALAFIIGYNVLLIQRDRQLYKAYEACSQFTHHPDCPYKK